MSCSKRMSYSFMCTFPRAHATWQVVVVLQFSNNTTMLLRINNEKKSNIRSYLKNNTVRKVNSRFRCPWLVPVMHSEIRRKVTRVNLRCTTHSVRKSYTLPPASCVPARQILRCSGEVLLRHWRKHSSTQAYILFKINFTFTRTHAFHIVPWQQQQIYAAWTK
jgi:hypothetical protein